MTAHTSNLLVFASRIAALAMLPLALAGCMHYTTPGRGVTPVSLQGAQGDIRERLAREPAAQFPARMAVVRVQSPEYFTRTTSSYGSGRYSVVTTRDVEKEESIQRIAKLPMIAGLAPLNRLLLQPQLSSDEDLRLAAASMKCDLLLIYTFDTGFRVDDVDVGPLTLISLGMLPTKTANVTATASAAIFDVRTGYIYGLAETTAKEAQIASSWSTPAAIDQARQRAEGEAFDQLVEEFEKTWKGIVEQHARTASVTAGMLQSK